MIDDDDFITEQYCAQCHKSKDVHRLGILNPNYSQDERFGTGVGGRSLTC